MLVQNHSPPSKLVYYSIQLVYSSSRECPFKHSKYLLHLEPDGGLDLVDLLYHVVAVSEEGGELAGLAETRAKQTGNRLDETVGREEGIILLGCIFF